MMNGNGQGQKLTNEERERLNKRETIAHDDPTALSTAAGRQAQREEDRQAGRVPPSEAEDTFTTDHDEVEHPTHYTSHPSGVECITVVEHMTFNVGNVVKYLWRAGQKTDDVITDLRKAEWLRPSGDPASRSGGEDVSGESKKTPRFLFWCDLETTGLSPREDDILEIAYALTEFRYPYPVLSRASFLVSCPGRIRLLQRECGEFIQGMHEASGLRADLSVVENTKTIPSIEADLLALSQDWPTDKDEKVVIAGSSVGTFDLQFLRNHLPTFTRRLSHRAFDISAVKLAARSLGMPSSSEKEPAHRASQDVDGSMDAMRRCVEWLSEHPSSRHPVIPSSPP